MPHWKSIYIERFRRLQNLRLDDLGSVNLLVGKNNSGKTSVLEALAIASNPTSATQWIDVGRERELKSARTPLLEVLGWFFPHDHPRENGYDGTAAMQVSLKDGGSVDIRAEYNEFRQIEMTPEPEGGPEFSEEDPPEYAARLEIRLRRYPRQRFLDEAVSASGPHSGGFSYMSTPGQSALGDPPVIHEFSGRSFKDVGTGARLVPCQLVTPVSHRTSRQLLAGIDQILEERMKPEVIRLLQLLAPDVEDIEIRSPQGRGAVIHLYHSKIGHVPLAVEGDGMRRALAFASACVQARGGVLLLDEVETALHPKALSGVFRFLVEICREQRVQLFVSTHSLEAVDAMLASVGDDVSGLVAYHLPPRDSDQTVYRMGGNSIQSMRSESGVDLR
jgi:energy-coupling factor transporter ATP-binding protein EcfA2